MTNKPTPDEAFEAALESYGAERYTDGRANLPCGTLRTIAAKDALLLAHTTAVAAAHAEEAPWQLIETAPHETEVWIGKWVNGTFESHRAELYWWDEHEHSGWDWSQDHGSIDNPTHWRPAPQPPEPPTETADDE